MKVAMTGGTGFLGANVARTLWANGARLAVLVRPTSDRQRVEPFCPRWVEGDLANEAALVELARDADVFIHLAGLTKAGSLEEYIDVNVQGTRRALQAASSASVDRFILMSSQAAAGPADLDGGPTAEDDEAMPRSAYGISKLMAESILEDEDGDSPLRIILRAGAAYGPYDKAFLPYFRLVSHGLRLTLGDGTRVFQPVFSSEIASACVSALQMPASRICRTYFIVGPETVTWDQFGRTVAEARGKTPVCVRIPEVAVQPQLLKALPWTRKIADRLRDVSLLRWEASPDRAMRELGWSATTPLQEGLRQTWKWYCDRKWL